ncbi:hypothetical protein ACC731_38430, partial [Rhizobium ruizarguesonis]
VVLLALYALFFLTSEEMHWAYTAPSVALVTGVLFFFQAIGSFVKFYLIGEKKLGARDQSDGWRRIGPVHLFGGQEEQR